MLSVLLMLQAMQIRDYSDMLRGLLAGLTYDPASPGSCHDQLGAVIDSATEVAEILKELVEGTNPHASEQLYVDGKVLFDILIGLKLDGCHFDELVTKIINLNPETVFKNYLDNFAKVTASALVLTECTLNYYGCGEDVGLIFRTLIDWGFKVTEVY